MAKKKKKKNRGAATKAQQQGRTSPGKSARAESVRRRTKRRKGRRTLHHILVLLFLLAAGVVLSLTFFFKIEQVTVIGTDRYDPLVIAASTGIQIGDNLFRVPTRQVEEALLEQYPWIDTVHVRRTLPPAIEVEIVQSVAEGAITDGDGHVLITREGKILDRGLLLLTGDVIVIRGVDVGDRVPGEFLGTWEQELSPSRDETADEREARQKRNAAREAHAEQETDALIMFNYLLDAIRDTGFEGITNLDLTDRYNMKVLYENRLTLLLGSEADLPDKLLFVQLVIGKLHPDAHGTLNVADVRDDKLIFTPAEGYSRDDGSPIQTEESASSTPPAGGGEE